MHKAERLEPILPFLQSVHVSHYPGVNDVAVRKYHGHKKFKIHNRVVFTSWPQQDIGPGRSCMCPRPRMIGDKVWQFGNCLAAILNKHNGDLNAVAAYPHLWRKVEGQFLNFKKLQPGTMPLCGYCVSRK